PVSLPDPTPRPPKPDSVEQSSVVNREVPLASLCTWKSCSRSARHWGKREYHSSGVGCWLSCSRQTNSAYTSSSAASLCGASAGFSLNQSSALPSSPARRDRSSAAQASRSCCCKSSPKADSSTMGPGTPFNKEGHRRLSAPSDERVASLRFLSTANAAHHFLT